MRIGRTLPPAASPIYLRDIANGFRGMHKGKKELERFEKELKDFLGVKYCFLLSSGKAALTVILRALKELHPERDEVLIPAFTCYSVPSAIVRAGLKVRLCDIDENTLDFNFKLLSRALSPKTGLKPINASSPTNSRNRDKLLAIVPTHLFGFPSDVLKLRGMVTDKNVTIVEDAAQAMGGEWKGQKLGTLGDVGFFSLGRGKAFSTVEGGIALTDREDIAGAIRSQMDGLGSYSLFELAMLTAQALALALFLRPRWFFIPKSMPFLHLGTTVFDPEFKMRKLSSFQAGLARLWRRRLSEYKKARARNRLHYTGCLEFVGETPIGTLKLSRDEGQDIAPVRYPLKISDDTARGRLLSASESLGLGIMPSYPDSINHIPQLKDEWSEKHFPISSRTARHLVTLPIHSFVTERDQKRTLICLREIADPFFWRKDPFPITHANHEIPSDLPKSKMYDGI